jgi:DtxR family transcriptional regulator, Mn-dependent transcriptional regulator
MPTTSVENYLKAIYSRQGGEERRVKTKEIAEALEVSLPSVSGMVKSLADEGLVDYEPYRGVRLTEEGKKAALRVIRNHRLIEVFLVQTLGYSWDEVHAEAERLEHAVSDKLVGRIDAYLSFPRFDPHGDPIPTAEGEVHHRDVSLLRDAEAGMTLRVERVMDQTPEVLRYLDRIGLRPGSTLHVDEVLSFDGQMFLRVGGEEVSISDRLAGKMLVTEINAETGDPQ